MAQCRQVKHILIAVLALNWFVALVKVVFGYTAKSAGMVSDGYHSFSDGASNIIGLIGVSISLRPKDEDHPYGHKKYETFAAIVIAFILSIIAFYIIHDTLERFRHPIVPEVTFWSFAVMIVTMGINIGVMIYESRMGKRLKSDFLVADSLHTRSDILTSLTVIGALIGVKIGYPLLDPVCSLIVALFIAYAAWSIVFSSSKVLCDTAMVEIKSIEALVTAIDGVLECHDIRTRGRTDDIHIDLHVLVHKDMTVTQADKLCDRIEEKIKTAINGVSDVVVHVEPGSNDSKKRGKGQW